MKLVCFLLVFISTSAYCLEVDEKLTVRVLRTSQTKKTIMINRGVEDGLVEGNHAKFITTAGVVARGVLMKLSPTRSIWSLYRLVNVDFIVDDAVLSLKITPEIKISRDETKMLVREDTPISIGQGEVAPVGIPLADGADDFPSDLAALKDEASFRVIDEETSPMIAEKNWEVFSFLHISGLSGSTQTDSGGETFSNSQSSHHIGLGGEIYSQHERRWYSPFSLQAGLNFVRLNSQAYTGATSENNLTEFSLGVNWHPTKLASQTLSFIPYFHLGLNFGSISSSFSPGNEASGSGEVLTASGATQGFSLGFGYKYFTPWGLSGRALLDYYSRTEVYDDDSISASFNKSVSGPRLILGLGYRF